MRTFSSCGPISSVATTKDIAEKSAAEENSGGRIRADLIPRAHLDLDPTCQPPPWRCRARATSRARSAISCAATPSSGTSVCEAPNPLLLFSSSDLLVLAEEWCSHGPHLTLHACRGGAISCAATSSSGSTAYLYARPRLPLSLSPFFPSALPVIEGLYSQLTIR